jgi:hypothetical protein
MCERCINVKSFLSDAVGIVEEISEGVYTVIIEEDATRLLVNVDERSVSIETVGDISEQKSQEAVERVRDLLRRLVSSLEPTKPF